MGYIFLIIHIVVVITAFILIKLRLLKVNYLMFVVIAFIPVWGMVSALIVSFLVSTGRVGSKSKDLESMRNNVTEGDILMVEAPESVNVVPLEDALIMDDPSIRRSVMLDVLMSDTKDYVPVINQARMNDDAEVVHYATTAMVELSKEYELKAQDFSTQYAENPLKEGLLEDYISFLEQYVGSNMIQGQLLEIQRNTLMQLLAEKVQRYSQPDDYEELAKALMAEKQYPSADTVLLEMEKKWPEDERNFKLRMRYLYETGAGNKIKEMVAKVNSGDRYYSREIREIVNLWQGYKSEELQT